MNATRTFRTTVAVATLGVLCSAPRVEADAPRRTRVATADAALRSAVARDAVPLHFEKNQGQTHESVTHLVRAPGYNAYFTPTETVFALPARRVDESDADLETRLPDLDVIRMRFVGAETSRVTVGRSRLPSRSHYLIGDDPGAWVRDVAHYAELATSEISPGVALRWRGGPARRLTYDLIAAPGADTASIAIRFDGAESIYLGPDGALRIRTPNGELQHSAPVLFQLVDGARRSVAGAFELRGDDVVGFRVGHYDRSRMLVIDPSLTYSTYIGGASSDEPFDVALDSSGGVYVAGTTQSADFPTASAYSTTRSGAKDAFVVKLSSSGSLAHATYIGGTGSGFEEAIGIAAGSGGETHVVGRTTATDFPTTSPFQTTSGGGFSDAFVFKLNAAGSSLVYSTYVGGSGSDLGIGIEVDATGAAYVSGQTSSTDFPTQFPIQSSLGGSRDAFVAKLNPSGSALVYSTYLGGTGSEVVRAGLALRNGEVFLTGATDSTDFPTVAPASGSPAQTSLAGGYDAFVTRVSASGSAWIYSTYLGGAGDDRGIDVAVDGGGSAHVVGRTDSSDFPTSSSALRTVLAGGVDAFVTKLHPNGTSWSYSTYVGGSGDEYGPTHAKGDIVVDASGVAHIIGFTASSDFPLARTIQSSLSGATDAFFARLNPTGSDLILSTYLGGGDAEEGRSVAVDGDGQSWVVGWTSSSNFPTTTSAPYSYSGGIDWFITRVSASAPPDAPADLDATVISDELVTLSWSDESAEETGFELQRAVADGEFADFADLDSDVETFEDATTAGAMAYSYRVRAVNEIGPSDWSDIATVQTPSPPPTGVSASSSSSHSVTLMWSDDADDETGYVVERALGCPGVTWSVLATLPPNSTSYTDNIVQPETTYSYRVRTQGSEADSTPSLEVCIVTGPASPTSLLAITRSDTGVLLRWGDNSAIESSYEIERQAAGGAAEIVTTVPANTAEHSDETVAAETEYTYRVRARTPDAVSSWSPKATTRTAPAAPSDPFGEAVSSSRLRLTWTDNSQVEKGFEVRRKIHGADLSSELVARLSPNTTSFVDEGLLQETSYDYTVNAYDSSGDSNEIAVDDLETTAVLVIRSVTVRDAKKKQPAKVTVKADIDFGGYLPDADDGATLGVNDTDFTTGVLELKKRGRVLSHKGDDFAVKLSRKSPTASRGSLKIAVTGDAAEIEDGVEVTISFTTGAFTAAGTIELSSGRFDLKSKKGLGRRIDPDFVPTQLKLKLAGPEKDRLQLAATLAPRAVPDEQPNALITVGGSRLVFDGSQAEIAGGKVTYRLEDLPEATLTIDYDTGMLKLKAKKHELGDYDKGDVPTLLDVIIGELRWRDVPVLRSSGNSASY